MDGRTGSKNSASSASCAGAWAELGNIKMLNNSTGANPCNSATWKIFNPESSCLLCLIYLLINKVNFWLCMSHMSTSRSICLIRMVTANKCQINFCLNLVQELKCRKWELLPSWVPTELVLPSSVPAPAGSPVGLRLVLISRFSTTKAMQPPPGKVLKPVEARFKPHLEALLD